MANVIPISEREKIKENAFRKGKKKLFQKYFRFLFFWLLQPGAPYARALPPRPSFAESIGTAAASLTMANLNSTRSSCSSS
jgi:hypothetical protein